MQAIQGTIPEHCIPLILNELRWMILKESGSLGRVPGATTCQRRNGPTQQDDTLEERLRSGVVRASKRRKTQSDKWERTDVEHALALLSQLLRERQLIGASFWDKSLMEDPDFLMFVSTISQRKG